MVDMFRPILEQASKSAAVIRLKNGGRLDFWTLGNAIAGRGRRYHRIVIDEAAFTKDGDNTLDDSMMAIWEKAIKPTLFDFDGEALVCSNSAGKDPDNFFYNICTDPKYGFTEYHATTLDNPLLPKRLPGESSSAWVERREQVLADLITDNDPLVYAQEYLADFVDWSGVAFFSREKLLDQGQPVPYPKHCDTVFAVIDTASKTGTDNDGTAVTFFAHTASRAVPLMILDWDIVQIEGALLETWLPSVFERLEELSRLCRARYGATGAWIEDKNSGTILLQQALNRGMPVHAIESEAHGAGQRRKSNFRVGLCSSRKGQIHRPRLQQDHRTSRNQEITWSIRSKDSGSATKSRRGKTISWTHSATGSRWPSETTRGSERRLLLVRAGRLTVEGLVTLLNEEREKAACRKPSSDRRTPGVHRRGAEAAVRRR